MAAGSPLPIGTDTVPALLETPFGPLAATPARELRALRPMPGLPGLVRFQLDRAERLPEPFHVLVALDPPGAAFVVLPLLDPGAWLRPAELEQAAAALQVAGADLAVLLIVTWQRGATGLEAFVNRRAPLFVDTVQRTFLQIVQADPGYAIRERLVTRDAG